MSECKQQVCPAQQRYLEADTVRLLYQNRLRALRNTLDHESQAMTPPLSPRLFTALRNMVAEIDESLAVAARLYGQTLSISESGEREAPQEQPHAKQG
jgi:hypothetical protein